MSAELDSTPPQEHIPTGAVRRFPAHERLDSALQDSRFVYDPFVFPAIVDFFKNVGQQIQAGQRFVGIIRR